MGFVRELGGNTLKAVCRVLQYLILTLTAIFVFLPIFWLFVSSFKAENEIYSKELIWFPAKLMWGNYKDVLSQTLLVRSFFNSLKIVLPPVLIGVFTSSMAGYAFAKLNFPGKKILFTLMFGTLVIPGVVTMIPSYLLFNAYGWLDTLLPLIVPGMFGSVLTMFFLRQYITGLPNDLQEAAIIDGLSYGGVFFRIYLPLAKPALLTQIILCFNGAYNDYIGPLLYINKEENQVIQIVLNSFISEYQANWQFMLAGSVLALLPTIILFVAAQKYFVEGIAFTGLKA